MSKQVRRVVTGHNASGKSIFILDTATPHVFSRTKGSAIVHELWETAETPADNRSSADAISRGHRLAPPKHGSVFRVIEYPPDSERLAAIAREHALQGGGAVRASRIAQAESRALANFNRLGSLGQLVENLIRSVALME